MTRNESPSADVLGDLASAIDLPLSRETASDFVAPVEAILESMEPVRRAPERRVGVDRVDTIDVDDPHNAFITPCRVERDGSGGELDGVSVGLKDNIALAGVELTAGSGMLEGFVPERNAVVAERLLDAGATILGKTNMDEFAFGPTGETSFYGPTANPVEPDHTPGGSSSGSAAAVAAGHVDAALGTDTGGSVRIPASYCGVLGVKPTQGAVPLDGVVELAGSLDTVGVLGTEFQTVADCLSTLGDDRELAEPLDPGDVGDLAVGVPDSLFDEPVRTDVADHVESAIDDLVAAGATKTSVSLPSTDVSSAVWRAITMSELYQYFVANALPYRIPRGRRPPFSSAFRGARSADVDRLSAPLKQYLLIGAYLVNRDGGRRYGYALDVRDRLSASVATAFEDVDVLVTPSTPTTAFQFGEFSRDSSPPINNNTHLFNLTGHPALSLPCGAIDGLPVGLQIVAELGADRDLLEIGIAVKEALRTD